MKIHISELWDGSHLHLWLVAVLIFCTTSLLWHLLSFCGGLVFHLNGDFQYNSRCNLREMLLFGMTKRGNRQFLVDNGGVLLTFDEIKCGKRHC